MTEAITARGLLAAAGAEGEARRETETLLMHALGRDRSWLFAHADEALPVAAAIDFHALLRRRATGEPVAYITGHREFWSLDLTVTPEVLIPRPETEHLVEQALSRLPREGEADVADLGTGSGAIALALAHERPHWRVTAVDASETALAVARGNAGRLGIGNVQFLVSDWFAALAGRRFDLIVSNPPYIAAGDAHLAHGDLRFEPALALSSGGDGLESIRAIARAAPEHLRPGGWLLFEHGHEQGEAVRGILARTGLTGVFTASDLQGHERVSGAQHKAS